MADRPGEQIVPGDRVRQRGSSGPYRKVLGRSRHRDFTRLWLEDPDHPGEPISTPIEITIGGSVDVEPRLDGT